MSVFSIELVETGREKRKEKRKKERKQKEKGLFPNEIWGAEGDEAGLWFSMYPS